MLRFTFSRWLTRASSCVFTASLRGACTAVGLRLEGFWGLTGGRGVDDGDVAHGEACMLLGCLVGLMVAHPRQRQ